jgi:uracil phosphoribosyltransferase
MTTTARTGSLTQLHVSSHPLVAHKITMLSSVTTDIVLFRQLVNELSQLMIYEATADLPLADLPVTTPMEDAIGRRVAATIGLVPILRAGLGMIDRAADILPFATVYHIGIYRDERTHRPISYYNRLPDQLEDDILIMIDPMLATAGSASATATFLKERGARSIRFVGLIAAPEGVQRMAEEHPDVSIYVARLDRQLDENKYIRPGLGDAGDRLFGTVP